MMAVLGVLAVSGPQARVMGRNIYLGQVYGAHLHHPDWNNTLDIQSRLAVLFVAALAYLATIRRAGTQAQRGWATRLGAVMALFSTLVLLHGLLVTRYAELGAREETRWGLWCMVPFVYSALL